MHARTACPAVRTVALLKLSLRQVTARMVGGLIQLESAPGEPGSPGRDQRATRTPLATTAQGAPLLQVDGQDDLVALQNRIMWDGLRVAYHQINAYRRDQTAQVGTVPKIYNRPAWMVAVGPMEEAPIHGDLKFVQKWSPDQPAWLFRRDDFRLTPDSPAASAGAELGQIPPAPDIRGGERLRQSDSRARLAPIPVRDRSNSEESAVRPLMTLASCSPCDQPGSSPQSSGNG